MLQGDVEGSVQALITDYDAQIQRLLDQQKTAGEETSKRIDKQIEVLQEKKRKAKWHVKTVS